MYGDDHGNNMEGQYEKKQNQSEHHTYTCSVFPSIRKTWVTSDLPDVIHCQAVADDLSLLITIKGNTQHSLQEDEPSCGTNSFYMQEARGPPPVAEKKVQVVF